MGVFDWLGRKIDKAELKSVALDSGTSAAFKNLALQIGISLIANAVSKCEFVVYRNGKRVEDELYYRLNVNPNPNQNSSEFINQFIDKLYRNGESLVIQNRDALFVADDFQIDERPILGDLFRGVSVGRKNKIQFRRAFNAADVFHFRLDSVPVKQLIDGIYSDYGKLISAAVDDYVRRCGRKYKIKFDQYRVGDKKFNETWDEMVQQVVKPYLQSVNAAYPELKGSELVEFDKSTVRGNAGDIINLRKEAFDIVAQSLKIPVALLYGNMTNMDEIANTFLTFCIDPLADMISEEITRKTASFEEWRRGSRVRVDTRHIRHADLFQLAPNIDKLISSGTFSINEIRRDLDMDKLAEAFADEHFVTKNYEVQAGPSAATNNSADTNTGNNTDPPPEDAANKTAAPGDAEGGE